MSSHHHGHHHDGPADDPAGGHHDGPVGDPAGGRGEARLGPGDPALEDSGLHLHFDCPSGAAGDMTLGALFHLGVPERVVTEALAALGLPGLGIRARLVRRGGLAACAVSGPTEGPHEPGRTWRDIDALLQGGKLPVGVLELAHRIFERLARAEAAVHGVPVAEVHFHEVGGLDAIADVVGVAAAMTWLHPRSVSASALPLGSGTVQTAHGLLPLPAPATVELLRGAPTFPGPAGAGELTTPTGAVLITTLADRFGPPPALRLRGQGFGAGSRERPGLPNALRVLAGEPLDQAPPAEAACGGPTRWVEGFANIDDMNPELGPWILERLLAAGARDAWMEPIVMKKGRAAVKIGFLSLREDVERLAACLLEESTTLGLRFHPVERIELGRHLVTVSTPHGEVRVKLGGDPASPTTVAPEHEDCRRLATQSGIPLKQVYQEALLAFHGPGRPRE